MIKKLKLFIILFLFFTCSLVLQNNVYANIHPTMSSTQAQLILDTYKNKDIIYHSPYYPSMTQAEIISTINQMNASIFASKFNEYASYLNYNFTWDDVSIVCFYGLPINGARGVSIAFIIAPNQSSNVQVTYTPVYPNDPTYIKTKNSYNVITISYFTDYNDWGVTDISQEVALYPAFEPVTENGDITNFNFFIGINEDRKVKYNNTDFTIVNDIFYFTDSGGIVTPEIDIGNNQSEYGCYYDHTGGTTEINVKNLSNMNFLNDFFYIGDELTYNYDYYYYSGDTKFSVKNYINFYTYRNSGDNGTFYDAYLTKTNAETLLINKNYYFDLEVTLNEDTETLANEFNSFYVNSYVVDSGQTGTITITNSSGDISSGEIDLTGIQAGIGDINSSLTNELDLSGETISSGDITSSLGFDLATDPYDNFWYNLTTGLSTALSTSVRTISITFQNRTYTINLDDYTTKTPTALKVFFATISTFFVLFGLFKFVKLTINKITSGDVDSLLKSNQNEGITNLF